ncbi:O-antigen ligase family protein [Photobacterium leiognathi]|uniref:O-antigen ligase family protein n=1 Tax=Photobacterium leiognathi TaxID=553611 RepID=UPI002980EFC4|nr:O-antigen ligase family protein [Photobacterium leiognathi]
MSLPRFLNREIIISLLVASFPVLCLAYGKGYNLAPILLLLTSFFFIPQYKKISLTPDVKLVITIFCLYFSFYALSVFSHHDKISYLDQPSRIVLVLPIFLMLLRYPPNIKWLLSAILVGSLIAGLSAIYQVYGLHLDRAYSGFRTLYLNGYMPIQSGNMAMTLGVMSLAVSTYWLKEKHYWATILSLLSAILGILGSFLSGSRGGWVFLPLALIYLVYSNRSYLKTKGQIALIAFLLVVGAITIQTPQVKERIDDAFNNVTHYEQGHDITSLGIRFELWKSAIYTFKKHPIFGAGYHERQQLRERWGKEGLVNKTISHYTLHSHNQYLEDLSLRGIVGLTSLILLLTIPFGIFNRNNRITSNKSNAINQCGAVSIILMSGYLLSQAMFRHNSGTMFFATLTVILLACSITLKREEKS